MKTYISPSIKTLVMTKFMQNINDIVSTAEQLGNEGSFDENESAGNIVSGKSVWED